MTNPYMFTFNLTSLGPVFTSPAESWRYAAKDCNTKKSKTDSRLIRGEEVILSLNICYRIQEECFSVLKTLPKL